MSRKTYTPFDPDTMGFGKHEYHEIDPATINAEDYARSFRGEEAQFGDIREYNAALNSKDDDNNVSLDWLSRLGTVFTTDAPEYAGEWIVVRMAKVVQPKIWARCCRVKDGVPDGDEVELDAVKLGCVADIDTNEYLHVKTKMVKKAKVDKNTMAALTKR